jgi:hypothetical protein
MLDAGQRSEFGIPSHLLALTLLDANRDSSRRLTLTNIKLYIPAKPKAKQKGKTNTLVLSEMFPF